MTQRGGNIFEHVPERLSEEEVTELIATPGLRVERIVSTGQASPAGFWYDQDRAEWVLVLAGSAGLLIEGEAEPRVIGPGDHVLIPAHAGTEWPGPTWNGRRSGWRCTAGVTETCARG